MRYYYKEDGKAPLAPEGQISGELITTNHSPYKGMNDFDVTASFYGMKRLLLPSDLSNDNLAQLSKSGPRGENAVIIGDFDGDGAGFHFSVRLICKSNMH